MRSMFDDWGSLDPQDPFKGVTGALGNDCPPDKQKFFTWLAEPMRKVAQDLNTTLSLVLTHAAKEAGWTIDHDQQLNNPFGVNKIKNGKAAGNIAYPSLDAAIDYYKARFGPNIAGSRTADDYINGLEHPRNGQGAFNSKIEKYTADFKNVNATVIKFMRLCGVGE